MRSFRAAIAAATILISGTAGLAQSADDPVRFHHVHINAVDPKASQEFYEHILGAIPVRYNDRIPAVFHSHGFILFNAVEQPAPTEPNSPIWHIGWAGVDGEAEYAWIKSQGVEYDTPPTPLGSNTYQYLLGPDRELIEIYTGARNHRYEHIHLWATDPQATSRWFVDNLGFGGRPAGERPTRGRWAGFLSVGLMNLYIFALPQQGDDLYRPVYGKGLVPSRGHVIDHIAYSFRDIDPVYQRLRDNGVEIVEAISRKDDHGHRSFFVMAPDELLVEIVEAVPAPESVWER